MILAVLIVLVVGGWLILSGGSGAKTAAGTHPSNSASPQTSLTNSPSPSISSTPTPSVSHTPSASHTPAAITLCPDSVIKVKAVTDATSYTAGQHPKLTVSVTNTGKVACKRDIGRAAMGLTVMSGSTRVWSSDDCAPGGAAAVNVLKPGQTFASTVAWERVTSKPGCPSGQPAAAVGSYTLVARNLTLRSTAVTFTLH
jgi:hypothetical protein